MFGRLQLGLQLLFGLSDVLVHLLSLLFLHHMKRFPPRRVFELKRPRLSEMWQLLSFPGGDRQIYKKKNKRRPRLKRNTTLTYDTLESSASIFQAVHPHHQGALKAPRSLDKVCWRNTLKHHESNCHFGEKYPFNKLSVQSCKS